MKDKLTPTLRNKFLKNATFNSLNLQSKLLWRTMNKLWESQIMPECGGSFRLSLCDHNYLIQNGNNIKHMSLLSQWSEDCQSTGAMNVLFFLNNYSEYLVKVLKQADCTSNNSQKNSTMFYFRVTLEQKWDSFLEFQIRTKMAF